MKNFENLSKEQLLIIAQKYSNYVEDCYENSIKPKKLIMSYIEHFVKTHNISDIDTTDCDCSSYKDITKEELLNVVREYSDYVSEYCDYSNIYPVCFDEFYENDYFEIPHKGDIVKEINTTDVDLIDWLSENKGIPKIISEVEYYGANKVWIENCPYGIDISEIILDRYF